MGTFRMHDHRNSIAASAPEQVIQLSNGHRVIQASAADIAKWTADPSTPMYSPRAAQIAAAAAPQPAPAADNIDPMWAWPRRFHTPGMRQPSDGHFNIPPVEGSASDIGRSHLGCAAQRQEDWK